MESPAGTGTPRAYIGVLFECCSVYVRIYRKPEAREYRGTCPRCGRAVVLQVGEGGSSSRLFRAR